MLNVLLQVIDSKVLRFPKAVTHFSPGSHASRPRQQTSFGNVFIAGDWVRDLDHGANGLSQERALHCSQPQVILLQRLAILHGLQGA